MSHSQTKSVIEEIPNIESDVDGIIEKGKVDQEELTKKKELLKEFKDYQKNPTVSIDYENMLGCIGDHKWKINPSGHIKKIRNQIKEHLTAFLEVIETHKTQLDILKTQDILEDHTIKILDLCLVDFNYDIEAEDPEVGPIQLKFLAQELSFFLVVEGGKGASKHSQMLQKLALFNP